MARREIPPERKTLYHVGQVLTVIGFLTFGSVFVTGALNFGKDEGFHRNFENVKKEGRSSALRAVTGMALIIVGGIIVNIGAAGAAGAGIVLDPQKEREDMEPWSRMKGGMLKDALDEAGIEVGQKTAPETEDLGEKLRSLHKLRKEGIISEAEYESKKKEILARM